MDAEKAMEQIIEALRNSDREAAEEHAQGLLAWLDDNADALAGYPEAWADLLAAVDVGHLEYCPRVGRLLDALDDPDGITHAICEDCRTFYYNGHVDAPEPGWSQKLAGAWSEQWQFVYEKCVEEIWTAPCAACRNRNAGKRYVWRVDAVELPEAAAPPKPEFGWLMLGFQEEGNRVFWRKDADGGWIFVLGVVAKAQDTGKDSDELHIVESGHFMQTRIEAMDSLVTQLRDRADWLEAKAEDAMEYEAAIWQGSDVDRPRWGVYCRKSLTWEFPRKHGKRAAKQLAKRLNKRGE